MKIIENAYSTVRETLDAIYRLVEEDEHKLSDIVVVTNSEKRAKFINSSPVEVVAIPTETYQSIWSSIQTLFKDRPLRGRYVFHVFRVDRIGIFALVAQSRFMSLLVFGLQFIIFFSNGGFEAIDPILQQRHS